MSLKIPTTEFLAGSGINLGFIAFIVTTIVQHYYEKRELKKRPTFKSTEKQLFVRYAKISTLGTILACAILYSISQLPTITGVLKGLQTFYVSIFLAGAVNLGLIPSYLLSLLIYRISVPLRRVAKPLPVILFAALTIVTFILSPKVYESYGVCEPNPTTLSCKCEGYATFDHCFGIPKDCVRRIRTDLSPGSARYVPNNPCAL